LSLSPAVESSQQYQINGGHEPGTNGDARTQYLIRAFSYYELAAATKNFREDLFLGQGGFGCVHKGWLDDGQVSAFSSQQILQTNIVYGI
jgi:hypothetical protein